MKKRKYKKEIGKCDYHICGKRDRVYRCKLCDNKFCKEHRKPKPVDMDKSMKKKFEDSKYYEEFERKDAHPCIPYNKHLFRKRDIEIDDYMNALDKLNKREPVKEEWVKPMRKNLIDRKIDNFWFHNKKKIITFLILAIIAYFIYDNFDAINAELSRNKNNIIITNNNYTTNNTNQYPKSIESESEIIEHPQEQKLLEAELESYNTQPLVRSFMYTFDGSKNNIDISLYKGLRDHLADIDRSYYCYTVCPTERELELKILDNQEQKKYLNEVVEIIKSKSNDKNEQLRIAVSIVQNIPYDYERANSQDFNERYPYEVLYDNIGVCGEKSKLLAFILREIGFGVSLFSFEAENHMTVGVKCPSEYDYKDSGYCFIETTGPAIITYSLGEYVGVGRLSSNPSIVEISDGYSFDAVVKEYNDKKEYTMMENNDPLNRYQDWLELRKKYGLEEKDCEIGSTLCNGECWRDCEENEVFDCTENGLTCEYDSSNCPVGTTSCNNECWQNCEEGIFKCINSGAICEI